MKKTEKNFIENASKEELNLFEGLKRSCMDFIFREYGDANSDGPDVFDDVYDNLEDVGVAYTNTPDEKYDIQCSYNFKTLSSTISINDVVITTTNYLDNNSLEDALRIMINDFKYGEFNDFVSVDEHDLLKTLNLIVDNDGNFIEASIEDLLLDKIDAKRTLLINALAKPLTERDWFEYFIEEKLILLRELEYDIQNDNTIFTNSLQYYYENFDKIVDNYQFSDSLSDSINEDLKNSFTS